MRKKKLPIFLHRVVHDSIILYISLGKRRNTKSRVPLKVLQLLIRDRCALGVIALIPHLQKFLERTYYTTEAPVASSLQNKRKVQEGILQLSSDLYSHGEYLLSKNMLNFALKATKSDNIEGIVDSKEHKNVSFLKIGEIYHNLGAVEMALGNDALARKYFKMGYELLSKQNSSSSKMLSEILVSQTGLDCENSEECDGHKMCSMLALGKNDRSETMVICYNNLGKKYFNTGKFREALSYFKQAINIIIQTKYVTGRSRLHASMFLAKLNVNAGATYLLMGDYTKAKYFITTSIDWYRQQSGAGNINLGEAYFNLGLVHLKLIELKDAENCFRRALEIYSKRLESCDKRIVKAYLELINVLKETCQSKEALALKKQYGSCIESDIPRVSSAREVFEKGL